ncbi:MAG: hypothetical protein GF418_10535 [Chitinivibrionales bacterium]|nr:hypothetical protein [Chitinivibrionales bacterium]MBD3396050.1 hypothetical protein [Chitinivibrionales bacterium]
MAISLMGSCGNGDKDSSVRRGTTRAPADEAAGTRPDSSPRAGRADSVVCARCDGAGEIVTQCPYCSGKGYQGTSRNPQTCIVCGGEGIIRKECAACGGAGKVSSAGRRAGP